MKISPTHVASGAASRIPERGFTLVEIAICLGIIGVALVAIIGILPRGLRSQKDSRQETIVGQDASVIFEAIRNGVRGADDLTNYIYNISNIVTTFGTNGQFVRRDVYGYAYTGSTINGGPAGAGNFPITNGQRIIGLLSIPELQNTSGNPTNNLFNGGFSNHVTALVRALSGVASERPPQDNQILREDSFAYRLFCVNAAEPVVDTNIFHLAANDPARVYSEKLWHNQRELRLSFLWPLLPNGAVGNNGRQTFRASIAGQLAQFNGVFFYNSLFFYQPQTFTNAP
jgi:prepilin-type N-terminal cleavage/methylation domain-containing protein